MPSTLIVGIILAVGFVFGEIADRFKLPKVTGYIIAGIFLNPGLTHIIPADFTSHTDFVTSLALSFITFSIGGTLLYSKLKQLGRPIFYITIFEAEFAFFAVVLGFLFIAPFFVNIPGATWFTTYIPLAILVGCLGSPTDPTATLAVKHEYKAEGEVSSTIMGVAAFDDVTGIMNYSLAVVVSAAFIAHQGFGMTTLLSPVYVIFGAVLLGIVVGIILCLAERLVDAETEGILIVLIMALLLLCFGIATVIGVDQLLATMTMGIVVVNLSKKREKIFQLLERYTEALIFVLFFTISGMQLNFGVLATSWILVIFFIIFRTIGKFTGAGLGAILSGASKNIKKYTWLGLIPQGGIVVGLALLIKQNPAFSGISDIVLSVVIGATVIHELIGPITAKMAMKKAGEINQTP